VKKILQKLKRRPEKVSFLGELIYCYWEDAIFNIKKIYNVSLKCQQIINNIANNKHILYTFTQKVLIINKNNI